MTRLFRALDDPIRRRVLELLRERDLTVGEIARHFDISLPSISYHLDLLRQADLVVSEKDGQYVRYTLNASVLDEALSWLTGLVTKRRAPAYDSKKRPLVRGKLAASRTPRVAVSRAGPALG
jgi:DNA-binding transcriptional ArsR family regulator